MKSYAAVSTDDVCDVVERSVPDGASARSEEECWEFLQREAEYWAERSRTELRRLRKEIVDAESRLIWANLRTEKCAEKLRLLEYMNPKSATNEDAERDFEGT